MDYQKMLFAAEVRKLAVEMQQAERNEIVKMYGHAQTDDCQDAVDAWDSEFPLSTFITRAHLQVIAVMEQLETMKAKRA